MLTSLNKDSEYSQYPKLFATVKIKAKMCTPIGMENVNMSFKCKHVILDITQLNVQVALNLILECNIGTGKLFVSTEQRFESQILVVRSVLIEN